MIMEYIKIKNFRSIKDELKINFSKNKTVLVGQNNAGKTNIISALNILFGEKYPTYFPITENDFFNPKENIEIKVKISEMSKESDYSYIKWKKKFAKSDKTKITFNKGSIILKFTANLDGEKNFECFVEKKPPKAKDEIIRSLTDEFRKSLLTFVFVPADRTTRVDLKTGEYSWYGKLLRKILESQFNDEKYVKLVTKLEEIEELIKEILKNDTVLEIGKLLTFVEDLKFSLTKTQEPKDLLKYIEILIKESTGDYIELSRFGHGTQSAILIGLLELYLNTLSQSRNSILKVFSIDEPENFLHPQGKRLINTLLDEISQDKNTQVIYTTHSSELVTNFEEEKFSLSDIVYVFKENGFTKVRQFNKKESMRFFKIQEELDVGRGELFFASGVILVEGETEKHSIPLIFKFYPWKIDNLPERYKDNFKDKPTNFFDLDRQNISVINVGGKDNIAKYFEFASKILGVGKVVAIVDKDQDFEKNLKPRLMNLVKKIFGVESENFENYGIFILPKGEFEHYYNVDVIKEFLIEKIVNDLETLNLNKINNEIERNERMEAIKKNKIDELEKDINNLSNYKKLSIGYEKLFSKYIKGYTKPTIAFKLTKFLIKNEGFDNEIFAILKNILWHLKI